MARLLRSSLECEVRGLDPEKREATFVASTERAVSVGPWEPEVLRMSGCNLSRYKKNSVLLDTHDRASLGSVIGSCKVTVEDRQLIATARYAKTERGEQAWQLVQDGHVRAVSIGYNVNPKQVTRLRDGETDGEGDALITGPASIVREWELLEVSNVPVPADEDAVRRDFFRTLPVEGKRVSKKAKTAMQQARADQPPMASDDETKADEEVETKAEGDEVTCPDCGKTFTPEARADETPETVAETGKGSGPTQEVLKMHVGGQARKLEQHRRDVLAITPRALVDVAENCILEGKTLEQTRAALKKAQAERFKAGGTLEPNEGNDPETPKGKTEEFPKDVTDDVLVRSLESLSG